MTIEEIKKETAAAEVEYKSAIATYQALTAKSKKYDNRINEGGEGYNPNADAIRLAKKAGEAASEKFFDLKNQLRKMEV